MKLVADIFPAAVEIPGVPDPLLRCRAFVFEDRLVVYTRDKRELFRTVLTEGVPELVSPTKHNVSFYLFNSTQNDRPYYVYRDKSGGCGCNNPLKRLKTQRVMLELQETVGA